MGTCVGDGVMWGDSVFFFFFSFLRGRLMQGLCCVCCRVHGSRSAGRKSLNFVSGVKE